MLQTQKAAAFTYSHVQNLGLPHAHKEKQTFLPSKEREGGLRQSNKCLI
jgi:hypothetical protein